MATFDKVTYTFYSDTMGRSVVPTDDDFNALKLTNIQLMKRWLPYVTELEDDGIDKAVCMMIETEYTDNRTLNGLNDNAVSSESVNGHNVAFSSVARTKLQELNALPTDQKKFKACELFLAFDLGVK